MISWVSFKEIIGELKLFGTVRRRCVSGFAEGDSAARFRDRGRFGHGGFVPSGRRSGDLLVIQVRHGKRVYLHARV